jgi:cobalt-zinc-cadmium efflux system outer membrane protein
VKQTYVLIQCIVLFSLGTTGFAQSGLDPSSTGSPTRRYSIEEATSLALRNNPEIKAAVRRVSLAETKTLTAGSLDDPMFMYRDWGTPLKQPWDLNQAQHMLALQQTFPGPGKRLARFRIGKDDVEVERAQLESLKQDISARVRKSFVDLLRNVDEMRLHDKQAALLHDATDTATSKYTVGKVPQADVLRAQILLTKLADHLIQLDQDRDLARAELNTLMGIDPATHIDVVGAYRPVTVLPSIVELEQTALVHRPELGGLRTQVKAGEDQMHLARLAYKPDYTVAMGYMLNPPGSMARNDYMAEFTISLPWLNRRKHDDEIKQADVATEVSRTDLEARRATVFLEVETALIKVRSAQKSMKLYRDTLTPQAEATFQAALVAYQNDRTDFLSLIDSENMLLDVETSVFKASAEADARLADLERAIGAPVTAKSQLADDREDK